VIAGTVVGNLHVEDGLQLLSSAHITGDVLTSRLSVAEGSVINGRISMNNKG
jgi:cytoskeletal protein CcmA (bactofilin family)